jgi:hypothetical protein
MYIECLRMKECYDEVNELNRIINSFSPHSRRRPERMIQNLMICNKDIIYQFFTMIAMHHCSN